MFKRKRIQKKLKKLTLLDVSRMETKNKEKSNIPVQITYIIQMVVIPPASQHLDMTASNVNSARNASAT